MSQPLATFGSQPLFLPLAQEEVLSFSFSRCWCESESNSRLELCFCVFFSLLDVFCFFPSGAKRQWTLLEIRGIQEHDPGFRCETEPQSWSFGAQPLCSFGVFGLRPVWFCVALLFWLVYYDY